MVEWPGLVGRLHCHIDVNPLPCHSVDRRKAVWGPTRIALALLVTFACWAPSQTSAEPHSREGARKLPAVPGSHVKGYKLDRELTKRADDRNPRTTTRVIVTMVPGAQLPSEFKKFAREGKLDLINGQVLDLPNNVLKQLANHPNVFRIHYDRPTASHNYRTSVTTGGRILNMYGMKGVGVGIAVIDSGITTYHNDLTASSSKLFPYGNQRVAKFVDFVNGRTLPYDDNGHGTHVAGSIAGNGSDSKGQKAGIAPGASLVSLKVLDANGVGTISRIIAALNWVAANHATYKIKVVNMSVGAGVYESYWTDPLTLAAKAVTDKGITVVTAAGNLGKNADGKLQWGGITAPGNAPWVLTVGASSTMGTDTRDDDTMGDFSSSGPTHIDFGAKPDLVAPGTGTVSLAVPGSTLYANKTAYLVSGSTSLSYKPYLALSGTSMAAPVVSGTVALMLEANPNLTPNLIKAILQYTAQRNPNYSSLRQGAGFLDSTGAVWMAYFFRYAQSGDTYPSWPTFSRTIQWGNQRITGGIIRPTANAWAPSVVWGSAKTMMTSGDNVVWGTMSTGDNVVWGTAADGDNVVWGTAFNGDNVVWGTSAGDNVVWGTDCGGADCDGVVWGAMAAGDNVVWGTASVGDNVVWGTASDINTLFATASSLDSVWASSSETEDVMFNDDAVEVAVEALPIIDVLPFVEPSLAPVEPVIEPTPVSPLIESTVTSWVPGSLGGC
jgi:serine protease AprX